MGFPLPKLLGIIKQGYQDIFAYRTNTAGSQNNKTSVATFVYQIKGLYGLIYSIAINHC